MVDYLIDYFGNYFTEISSAHQYETRLLLCKNIIYPEWKRLWVSFI